MNYFADLITNNYLLVCGLLFLLFALLTKNKVEWSVLAVLSFLLLANKSIFDHSGVILYYIRGFATTIAAVILMTRLTVLGFYQGLLLILMVVSYLALAFDVSQGEHILIYNNFGAAIHGLVFCQFLGILTTLRNIDNPVNAGDNINTYNHEDGKSL